MNDYIHRPDDGRGIRNVYVDGQPLQKCCYADEKLGIAHAYVFPYKLNRHGTAAMRFKVRGRVYVAALK